DDEGAGDAREVGGQALGHAVDEIVLGPIAAEIGERQHDERQPRRFALLHGGDARRGRGNGGIGLERMDPYRPGDVLELLLAEIDEALLEPVADVLVSRAGEDDSARLANPL